MKKVLRKIIMSKVSRILAMSTLICSAMTFAILLINSVQGVSVSLEYYVLMALGSTVLLAIGLVLFDAKEIFTKKKKVIKKVKMKKSKRNKAIQGKHRRKIS